MIGPTSSLRPSLRPPFSLQAIVACVVSHESSRQFPLCLLASAMCFSLFAVQIARGAEPAQRSAPPQAVLIYRLAVDDRPTSSDGSEASSVGATRSELLAAERLLASPFEGGMLLTTYDSVAPLGQWSFFTLVGDEIIPLQLWSADPWMNLALLRDSRSRAPPLPIGAPRELAIGERVVVAHYASQESAPREGRIAARNLRLPASPNPRLRSLHEYGGLVGVAASSPLPPGASLLDAQGAFRLISLGRRSPTNPEQFLCIELDASCAKAIAALREGAPLEYGFLGLEPGAVANLPSAAGREGVYARYVMQHSPAQQAGLREENPRTGEIDLITHINGQPVKTPTELLYFISRIPFGETVSLNVQRGKLGDEMRSMTLECKLAKRYIAPTRPIFSQTSAPTWRGLTVDHYTAVDEYPARARLVDPKGCVAIVAVEPTSPAWRAGLRPGMFLSHLGDARVRSAGEFHEAASHVSGPVEVTATARPEGVRFEPQTYEVAP